MKRNHPLDTAAHCVGYLERMESDKTGPPIKRREARSALHDLRKAIMSGKQLNKQIDRAMALEAAE